MVLLECQTCKESTMTQSNEAAKDFVERHAEKGCMFPESNK